MRTLLDQESFWGYVEKAVKDAGLVVPDRKGPLLYVVMAGSAQRFDLRNLYLSYQAKPHRLDKIVQEYVNVLQSAPAFSMPSADQDVFDSIFPLLRHAEFLTEAAQQNKPPLLSLPFLGDIVITYVLDLPAYRAYLNTEMVSTFMNKQGGSIEMIHQVALQNLRRLTKRRHTKQLGPRKERMMVCDTNDGFAATRILLPDLMAKWARRIPGQMLIAIPNRDFLIAFSERNRQGVKSIARQVRIDAVQRPHPLSAKLFMWQEGAIQEYHATR